MPGLLWRILFAVISLVLVFALLPPLLRIIGLPISSDVMLVIRVCIIGLAVYYILRGPWSFPPP